MTAIGEFGIAHIPCWVLAFVFDDATFLEHDTFMHFMFERSTDEREVGMDTCFT
jgi:hypothetical protein